MYFGVQKDLPTSSTIKKFVDYLPEYLTPTTDFPQETIFFPKIKFVSKRLDINLLNILLI